jgi:hypothetical protein
MYRSIPHGSGFAVVDNDGKVIITKSRASDAADYARRLNSRLSSESRAQYAQAAIKLVQSRKAAITVLK